MKVRWTDEERAAVRREYLILSGIEDTTLRLRRAQQVLPENRQRPFVKQNADAEIGRWYSATPVVEPQQPTTEQAPLPPVVVEIATAAVVCSQLSWRELCAGIVRLLKEDTARLKSLNAARQIEQEDEHGPL